MTQQADLIIAIGMRFSDRVTGNAKGYARNARIIHVEIDPVEIGKAVRADLPIVGDAKAVLDILNSAGLKCQPRTEWWTLAREIAAKEAARLTSVQLSDKNGLTMALVVQRISMLAGNDKIVVTDVGVVPVFLHSGDIQRQRGRSDLFSDRGAVPQGTGKKLCGAGADHRIAAVSSL